MWLLIFIINFIRLRHTQILVKLTFVCVCEVFSEWINWTWVMSLGGIRERNRKNPLAQISVCFSTSLCLVITMVWDLSCFHNLIGISETTSQNKSIPSEGVLICVFLLLQWSSDYYTNPCVDFNKSLYMTAKAWLLLWFSDVQTVLLFPWSHSYFLDSTSSSLFTHLNI